MRKRAEALAEIRHAKGKTQAEVAERAGWQQTAVSRLELDGVDARVSTLQRYADALGGELKVIVAFRGGEERVVRLKGDE